MKSGGRVPPSPTTLLIEQADRGVREAVEGIPGEGILTPLTGRRKQHSQESGQPLSPSTYQTMGDGLADREPADAATGGSEFRDASKDASKDESETLSSSQKKRIKKRIKKKASKDKLVAEEKAPKAKSGVHTRFRQMKPCADADSDSSVEDFAPYGDPLFDKSSSSFS